MIIIYTVYSVHITVQRYYNLKKKVFVYIILQLKKYMKINYSLEPTAVLLYLSRLPSARLALNLETQVEKYHLSQYLKIGDFTSPTFPIGMRGRGEGGGG